MNIADRALLAHQAEEEAKRLTKEALRTRRHAYAVNAIELALEPFGLSVDPGDIEAGYPKDEGTTWTVSVQVDDDVSLLVTCYPEKQQTEVRVRASEQLYWDLPPGQEKKGPGGGSYGCYGLGGGFYDRKIITLAQLGEAIALVRTARRAWRKKHLPEREGIRATRS